MTPKALFYISNKLIIPLICKTDGAPSAGGARALREGENHPCLSLLVAKRRAGLIKHHLGSKHLRQPACQAPPDCCPLWTGLPQAQVRLLSRRPSVSPWGMSPVQRPGYSGISDYVDQFLTPAYSTQLLHPSGLF